MITSGIQQLSADDVADILNKVNNFDDFSEDNDLYAAALRKSRLRHDSPFPRRY
mgnify:FL=1